MNAAAADRRILYVVNAFQDDAPTGLMLHVARAAQRAGNLVRVVALSRGGSLSHAVAAEFGSAEVLSRKTQVLKRVVHDHHPDIVHVTLSRPAFVVPPLIASISRAAIVITQNGIHEWREGGKLASLAAPLLFRRSARAAAAVVAISDAVRHDLQDAGVPAGKLVTIHNGVDIELFRPADHPDPSPAVPVICAAGNLRRIKGHEHLISAAAGVLKEIPYAEFRIYGEGPERPRLEALARGLHLDANLKFAGRVPDLHSVLPECDLFVQPSLSEGFGLAAAEAMSCAVPVIASNVGGLAELIADSQTGLLVPPADPSALACAIKSLLMDPERRRRMGIAGRERILQRFSVRQMCLQYLDLYSNLPSCRGAK